MVQQLTIFEVTDPDIIPFEIGDIVRIVIPKYKRADPESFYYLQDFTKKRGVITKVVHAPSLQYHVDFDGKEAIVYHDEVKYW